MGNIPSPDIILLWCPVSGAINPVANGIVNATSGYPLLVPYSQAAKHYPSVGTLIQLDTGIDLTNAVSVSIQVIDPQGSTRTWSGAVVALPGYPGGIQSGIQYVTQTNDFYYTGTFIVQPAITFSNWSGYGETATFTIESIFNQEEPDDQ